MRHHNKCTLSHILLFAGHLVRTPTNLHRQATPVQTRPTQVPPIVQAHQHGDMSDLSEEEDTGTHTRQAVRPEITAQSLNKPRPQTQVFDEDVHEDEADNVEVREPIHPPLTKTKTTIQTAARTQDAKEEDEDEGLSSQFKSLALCTLILCLFCLT